jgi:hypothetical protein
MIVSFGAEVKYKLENIVAQRQKPVNPTRAPDLKSKAPDHDFGFYMENTARMC